MVTSTFVSILFKHLKLAKTSFSFFTATLVLLKSNSVLSLNLSSYLITIIHNYTYFYNIYYTEI